MSKPHHIVYLDEARILAGLDKPQLVERKIYPVGARRLYKVGDKKIEHEKTPDGKWVKVPAGERRLPVPGQRKAGKPSGAAAKGMAAGQAARKRAQAPGKATGAAAAKPSKEAEDEDVSDEEHAETKKEITGKLQKALTDVTKSPEVSGALQQAASPSGIAGGELMKTVMKGFSALTGDAVQGAAKHLGNMIFPGLGVLLGGAVGALVGKAGTAVKSGIVGGVLGGIVGAFVKRRKVRDPSKQKKKGVKKEGVEPGMVGEGLLTEGVFENTYVRLGKTQEEASKLFMKALIAGAEAVGKGLTPEKYEELLKSRTLNREVAKLALKGAEKAIGEPKNENPAGSQTA